MMFEKADVSEQKPVGINDLQQFAWLWSLVLLMIAVIPLLHHHPIKIWPLWVMGMLLICSVLSPRLLIVFYTPWMAFAKVMGAMNTRMIMTVMFYGLITPIGLIMRLMGQDPLKKRWQPEQASYWLARCSQPNSMKHPY